MPVMAPFHDPLRRQRLEVDPLEHRGAGDAELAPSSCTWSGSRLRGSVARDKVLGGIAGHHPCRSLRATDLGVTLRTAAAWSRAGVTAPAPVTLGGGGPVSGAGRAHRSCSAAAGTEIRPGLAGTLTRLSSRVPDRDTSGSSPLRSRAQDVGSTTQERFALLNRIAHATDLPVSRRDSHVPQVDGGPPRRSTRRPCGPCPAQPSACGSGPRSRRYRAPRSGSSRSGRGRRGGGR
jgi:hypothetical protein